MRAAVAESNRTRWDDPKFRKKVSQRMRVGQKARRKAERNARAA
jgi:hypothetical protein